MFFIAHMLFGHKHYDTEKKNIFWQHISTTAFIFCQAFFFFWISKTGQRVNASSLFILLALFTNNSMFYSIHFCQQKKKKKKHFKYFNSRWFDDRNWEKHLSQQKHFWKTFSVMSPIFANKCKEAFAWILEWTLVFWRCWKMKKKSKQIILLLGTKKKSRTFKLGGYLLQNKLTRKDEHFGNKSSIYFIGHNSLDSFGQFRKSK